MHTKPSSKSVLPTIPVVAFRLVEMLVDIDRDVPIDEIVRTIQTDPAITARVLKAANSSLFAGGKRIDSLERAVIWIGRQTIICLALSFSLSEKAREGGPNSRYFKEYWLHSLITALAQEYLAKTILTGDASAAFVTGLLQDIGRLAFLQNRSEAYIPVLAGPQSSDSRLIDLELVALGESHPQVSADMLASWALPESMVAAARYHESSVDELRALERDACFPQILAANVAAATADYLCGVTPYDALSRLAALATKCNLSTAGLSEYLKGVGAQLHATAELFSADTSSMPSATELLACATEKLTELWLQAQFQGEGHSAPSDEACELRTRLYELERRNCLDALTGIYTRDYFDVRLTERIRRSHETPIPVGILFADLDKFKRINDTLGHLAGDEVLRKVAQVIHDNVRRQDIVARYGGEEFVILLDRPTVSLLQRVGERIRRHVAATSIPWGNQDITPTISIGGAFVPRFPADYRAKQRDFLMEVADRMMYDVKRRGGDGVHVEAVSYDDYVESPEPKWSGRLEPPTPSE